MASRRRWRASGLRWTDLDGVFPFRTGRHSPICVYLRGETDYEIVGRWAILWRAIGHTPHNSPMARILVSGVSVDFPLYHGSSRSLKKTVFAAASGHINRDRQSRAVVSALREIGFQLLTGDRLGLVGGNGAGKTTLLRVLAGIYEPVAGHVRVEGSLTALIDPNLGMNQDLTGRENILLRGLYGGLTRAAIRQLEEDIRDFTELGQFLDLPVRLYSSGMMVRLGFALATAVHPQVLLMDEWFLAGDSAFMRKARGRLENMVRGAELLVLSSHEVAVLQAWCTRVIWLDHGRVRADGSPQEVLDRYLGHPRPARATYETVSPERREAAESTKIGTSLGEMEGDGGRAIKG